MSSLLCRQGESSGGEIACGVCRHVGPGGTIIAKQNCSPHTRGLIT